MLEEITQTLIGFLREHDNPLGLLVLGLSALLEYLVPPFPGDTVTLFGAFLVTRHGWSMPLVFGAVLIGSGIGAMADFYIGRWMGRRYHDGRFIRGEGTRKQIERVLDAFRRHGEIYVAINRFLPALRAVFFLAAGLAGLRAGRVLFFSLLSAALWNALIISVGYAVGTNWARIRGIFAAYSVVAWSLVAAIVVGLLIRWLLRRRKKHDG